MADHSLRRGLTRVLTIESGETRRPTWTAADVSAFRPEVIVVDDRQQNKERVALAGPPEGLERVSHNARR